MASATVFTSQVSSTLEQLEKQYQVVPKGADTLEAWVFSDTAARQRTAAHLRRAGWRTVRIRSAYKPLIHFFIDEDEQGAAWLRDKTVTRLEVAYPICKHASPRRFLLEAYPLSELVRLANKSVTYTPANQAEEPLKLPATCAYTVTAYDVDGEQVGATETVAAPNYLHVCASYGDDVGRPVDSVDQKKLNVSPTGWIRVRCADSRTDAADGEAAAEPAVAVPLSQDETALRDERLLTDAERAFHGIMEAVQNFKFAPKPPYFERLCLHVEVPVKDEPIPGMPHEVLSIAEALHEDLYFSLNEYFKIRERKPITDRTSQPGQIIPYVKHAGEGVTRYSIEVVTAAYHVQHVRAEPVEDLATADHPLPLREAQEYVTTFDHGRELSVPTVCGQKVRAVHVKKGSGAVPVYMNGSQHANETSGVVGVLRAAQTLATRDNVEFVMCPVENPDGYCLHQEYIKTTPFHMLHAARYTALGDDLEYRVAGTGEPLYEKNMRYTARAATKGTLHLNLHGYPSHEWTRPFSGYIPAGFDLWTVPKGFFLVVRYNELPGWDAYAEAFTQALTKKLNAYPDVLELNDQQVALYKEHAGELEGFRIVNRFPCIVSAVTDSVFPLTVFTEYPDETIYGDDFIAAHNIQHAFAVAAYEVHQDLYPTFVKDGKLTPPASA